MFKIKRSKGFTVPELLAIIAIVFILITISLIALTPDKGRALARDSKRINELNSLRSALKLYQMDHGKYPEQEDEWCSVEFDCDSLVAELEPYIEEIPEDPLFGKGREEGNELFSYQYISISSGEGYKIHADMELREDYEVYVLGGQEITYSPGEGGAGGHYHLYFNPVNYSCPEDAEICLIGTVELSNPAPAEGVTVEYYTEDGTAISPDDYAAQSGILSFDEGEQTKNLTTGVVENEIIQGDIVFYVQLENAVNADILSNDRSTVTIEETDWPEVGFPSPLYIVEVDEDDIDFVRLTVELSSPAPVGGSSIDWRTVGNTALEGEDYRYDSGTLSFASGEQTKDIVLEEEGSTIIINDSDYEPQEEFSVLLTNPVNATIKIEHAEAKIRINSEDPFPNLFYKHLEDPAPVYDYRGNSIALLDDGGYIIAGDMLGATDKYSGAFRFNSLGELQWARILGGSTVIGTSNKSVTQTSDGGYIMTGYYRDNNIDSGYTNAFIVKLDSSGVPEWSKIINNNTAGRQSYGYSVKELSDRSGYILTGSYYAWSGYGAGDLFVAKVDLSGNLLWFKHLYEGLQDSSYHISETSDGGFIITGHRNDSSNDDEMPLVKLDSAGEVAWAKSIGDVGGGDYMYGQYVEETSDGGYLVIGYGNINSSNYNGYLVKLTSSGSVDWSRKMEGSVNDDRFYSGRQTSDGGYIITGKAGSLGDTSGDILLIKTDYSGAVDWAVTSGNAGYADYGNSVVEDSLGAYIITGYFKGISTGKNHAILARFSPEGDTECFYSSKTVSFIDGNLVAHNLSLSSTDITSDFQMNDLSSPFEHEMQDHSTCP